MATLEAARNRLSNPKTLTAIGGLLWVETVLVGWYLLYAPVRITDPLVVVYPMLWINASLLALWIVESPGASRRGRILGTAFGIGYLLLLAYVGGLVSLGHSLHGHSHAFGFRIAWPLPPGWGPTLIYSGTLLGVSLIPYKVIGYATLSYLVYVTVVDTTRSAWAGVVGLFSCVSCTWPVLGTVLAGALGSSSVVVSVATEQPFWASTLVFLSAIGLLLWRPFEGRLPTT